MRRALSKIGAVVVLVALLFPATVPVRAATAAIGSFYGGCGNFSVDVAINGTNNDGNNVDKFRYLITDGNNKKLYQEDATRALNTTLGSMVFNLSYDADGAADGGPGKNPITFAVQELDGNNNVVGTIQSVTYNAPCLAAVAGVNRSGVFKPPKRVVGTIIADTPLFQGPASGQLNLAAHVGAQHWVVYRSADSQWVAIFVGGNDLVWIPASTIRADFANLALPPARIDGSSLAPSGNSVVPVGPVTARVLVTALRFRAAPSSTAPILTTIPFGTVLPVLGRNARRTYIKVNYNGVFGWVSSFYVRLSGARLAALPVVD
jgi:Bacterial SH3 domain